MHVYKLRLKLSRSRWRAHQGDPFVRLIWVLGRLLERQRRVRCVYADESGVS